MGTILYATDLHLTDKQPSNRITPVENCLAVFENLLQKAKSYGNVLVLGGDLFDTPHPSYSLLCNVMALLVQAKVDVYLCVGNHDMSYATMDTASAVYVLQQANLIKFINILPAVINGFCIYGYNYSPTHTNSFFIVNEQSCQNLTTVVVAHYPIVTQPVPYKHILAQSLALNSDYLLCGHIHEPFITFVPKSNGCDRTHVINPGCLFRIKRSEQNIKPRALVLHTINGKCTTMFVDITGDDNPEFRHEVESTINFTEAVESAKIDVDNVESFINNSRYDSVVKDAALKLIKEQKVC